MNPTHHSIKPTSPRVYLVLLHVMFLVLYGVHLLSPMTRVQAGLSLALATLTLLLVTLPRAQLNTAWFVGLLTVGNMGVLVASAAWYRWLSSSWPRGISPGGTGATSVIVWRLRKRRSPSPAACSS